MLGALVWLPQAGFIAYAVQRLADGGGFASILWPAVAVGLLGVLRAGLEALGGRLSYRRARNLLTTARARAVAVLAAGSPLDTRRHPAGLAASVLAEQAEAVLPYLARFKPVQARLMVLPFAILLAVAFFSWIPALILLIAAPLIPLFMALVGWRAKAASEEQLVELGDMNAFLLDRLRGLATIRGLGAVETTARRVHAAATSLKTRTMAVLRIAFLSSAVLELFSALGVAMVAVYIGFHLLGQIGFGAWGARLTLGEGLFVLLLAPAFFEPLRDLSTVWHDRAAGAAGLKALDGLLAPGLELPGALDRAEPNLLPEGGALAVDLRGIGFRHEGAATPVFDGFDLHVHAGERIALLGPSGAGKSTLLSLIAGLVPAQEGRIAVGGRLLGPETASDLRRGLAWIGQRPHFFAGSLRANVALGRPEVDLAAVEAAVADAQLQHVAGPGASRDLGEGGLGLSGGEALRLALARAAATQGLGLVLADEPTAHLDRATADEVIAALLRLTEGVTLIVATHDPALAAAMDRTIHIGGTSSCAAVA